MLEVWALLIPTRAAPDAVLHLWTTDPMPPRSLGVIEAWSRFARKTLSFGR